MRVFAAFCFIGAATGFKFMSEVSVFLGGGGGACVFTP